MDCCKCCLESQKREQNTSINSKPGCFLHTCITRLELLYLKNINGHSIEATRQRIESHIFSTIQNKDRTEPTSSQTPNTPARIEMLEFCLQLVRTIVHDHCITSSNLSSELSNHSLCFIISLRNLDGRVA
jgi:hypothetical protein